MASRQFKFLDGEVKGYLFFHCKLSPAEHYSNGRTTSQKKRKRVFYYINAVLARLIGFLILSIILEWLGIAFFMA